MKILDKYIFRQFAKSFIFASVVFVCLFILINMVEKLDDFIDNKLTPEDVALYYLLSVPSIILITSPVSALLSSILVAGRLAFSSELPAIQSAGVSMRQLLHPFLAGGMLIVAMNLVNAWWIAPAAFSKTRYFEQLHSGKNNSAPQESSNIHLLEPDNRIVSIGIIDSDHSSLGNVTIEKFSGARLISRTDADSMHFDPAHNKWIMRNVTIRTFDRGAEKYHVIPSEAVKLAFSPHTLAELNLLPDEMNIIRHYRYLADKRKAGFSGLERSMVKFHDKIALPFASLIITLVGVPLSAKKKRGGLASEIAITLFTGFFYLGLQKTVAIFGYQGLIPPALAAWFPNLLFLCISYLIYKKSVN